MTLYVNCQKLSKAFGNRILFEELSFSIFSKDRIALIGPNGSGKSTLLKIMAGLESPSSGSMAVRKGTRIGYVPQTCSFPDLTPKDILLQAIKDDRSDYEKELEAETWLSKLGFKGDEPLASQLSGGWKKRLSIAQQLIQSPDLLLLDEPTNHLDLEGILWLEKFLRREAPCYLLVSHDRAFLQNMVSRVIEINYIYPEGLFTVEGSYANFLEKREQFISGQLEQQRSVASKARKEQAWLRESPKARTTKAQSRIDGANEVLQELADLKNRNRTRTAAIDFSATERETKKLLTLKNVAKSLSDRLLFNHLDFTLSPGTRMGLMGPNGSGKTTLLRILAGEITPDQGTIKMADDLKIVYFDQHRNQLPDHITLREALSPTGDFVNFRGQLIHVNGWCKRFLFSPDILDMPIDKLSGGERARIAIAHLMLQPADILLLDEPTNDLDIATLETLEESLLEFPGALILITHDRFMLNRICSRFLVFGDPHNMRVYVDYAQWEASLAPAPEKSKEKKEKVQRAQPKLSYAEKKELEQLEKQIADLEGKVRKLNGLLETPEVALDAEKLRTICAEIGLHESHIERLYLRFMELS